MAALLLHASCLGGCGGYVHTYPRRKNNQTAVEWARNETEYLAHVGRVQSHYGIVPTLETAPGVGRRWEVVARLIKDAGARSVLDVGGVGTYAQYVERYRCINTLSVYHCTPYDGLRLPYGNSSVGFVLAESTLHHVADDTITVLREMVRVSSRYVAIGEDILERRASADVFEAYRRHDNKAVFRSLDEWMALASLVGLRLRRVAFLHRVPAHVKALAPICELGYAPMVYLVWEKTAGSDVPCNCRRGRRGRKSRLPAPRQREEPPTNVWTFARREEERAAGLRHTKKYG